MAKWSKTINARAREFTRFGGCMHRFLAAALWVLRDLRIATCYIPRCRPGKSASQTRAMSASPTRKPMSPYNRLQYANILHHWQLSDAELSDIIQENPSLRGMLFGYVSEYKVRKTWFERKEFTEVKKYDDHDRSKKGDLSVMYKGVEIKVEVKGLQTNSVKQTQADAWEGNFSCDASDRRKVTLPNGRELSTTCLLVGEFDLLAVSLFPFGDRWRFAFALNGDLPRSAYNKYHETEERPYLLKSNIKISWPLVPPYHDSPFPLLDRITGDK